MKTYLVLLGCTLPLLLLAACTSAAKCTRGEVGCKCADDESCAVGARCISGSCVAESNADASSAGDAATENDASVTQKPVDCAVSTFNGACEELCRALCKSEENLCVSSRCEDPHYCDPDADLLADCADACVDDVACLQDLCTSELTRKCEEFGYEEDGIFVPGCFENDPKCVLDPDSGCSDTCGTNRGVNGELASNRMCEDGGEGSVAKALCPRSTDCTDCGTRVCGAQGDTCTNGGDCCGFATKSAYCVDLNPDKEVVEGHCLVTCTAAGTCSDGFKCTPIQNDTILVCSP